MFSVCSISIRYFKILYYISVQVIWAHSKLKKTINIDMRPTSTRPAACFYSCNRLPFASPPFQTSNKLPSKAHPLAPTAITVFNCILNNLSLLVTWQRGVETPPWCRMWITFAIISGIIITVSPLDSNPVMFFIKFLRKAEPYS